MSEIILPRWDGVFKASRPNGHSFTDACQLMLSHFYFYERIYAVLAPFDARQRIVEADENGDDRMIQTRYVPPTEDFLRAAIFQGRAIKDAGYKSAIKGLVKFCTENKGQFALPVPHPTTVHSIQLAKGSFSIKKIEDGKSEVSIDGLSIPFIIEGLRNPNKVQHLVVRPKSSSSGVAVLDKWEILTFEEHQGYIPLWVDSTANPRFAGMI